MAGRNIQVNLQFNANVQNAKAQLQSLQTQLNNLINSNAAGTSLGITPQIQEATRSAMDLKIALNNAMNVNTGKLNLNKFQSELNRMGKDIGYFAQQMKALGPEGVKAFTQVASAVAQADTKLFSLQGGMKKLANTFMNTVRWQLTSQAIMAVTNAISETVSYAKDLDTSLNNIRIVTGKSADQMATFAKQANNAAKVLSTSTTKYTDASLIYYQQGLNDKAVKERTDVTVKLANVVGESAQTVSEWMTAIWNNFDNGSESLEYYADVLAKLGAATASSADEIAGGLEKFAAVADTIGLSYEYAASALATITAETRQSEDVVGTALKTILSRMEQLKLGNNLDDGTSLGQYSLALQKVGVDIMDANKELKDMDIILQQTGTRWETLARDEQIALAQSVAGIRQYTQFMALMDNWDVMEENLDLTEQANGALQEQQRIYEESTKAAEERMKVASEAIKVTLLGGDDLTDLYNFGAGALEVINELLEAFGGLPTILLAVAAALTKVYQPQLASFLSQAALAGKDLGMSMLHPVKAMKGELVTTGQSLRLDTLSAAKDTALSNSPTGTASLIQAEFDAKEKLIRVEKQLSASTQQRAQWELDILETQKGQVLSIAEQAEKQVQAAEQSRTKVSTIYGDKTAMALQSQANAQGAVQSHLNMAANLAKQGQKVEGTMDSHGRTQMGEALGQQITAVEAQAKNLGVALTDIKGFENLQEDVTNFATKADISLQGIIEKINQVQGELAGGVASKGVIENAVNESMTPIEKQAQGSGAIVKSIDNLQNIQEPTSGKQATSTLNTIDKNLNNIDSSKLTSKAAKAKIDAWKKESAEIKKLNKNSAEYKKRTSDLVKDIKKHTNVQDKNNKTLKGSYNANKRLMKSEEELNKTRKQKRKQLTAEHAEMVKGAEATETSEAAIKTLGDEYDEFGEKLNNGGAGFKHWSDTLATGISNMATYAMGVSMLTSSFENLFSSIGRGDATWKDWVSSISSAMMSLSMLMPVIAQVITSTGNMVKAKQQDKLIQEILNKQGLKDISLKTIKLALAKKEHGASQQEIQDEYGEATANVISALAENSKNAGKGPVGWAMFAAGLAMILPIAAMVGISAAGGAKSGAKEAKQEEVSKGTETLEAINENQELAESVTDLTEEYNALRNAGESTADVLENMREKIPELIDSYKELAKTMGTHIDTTGLEEAYDIFEKTGDISLFQKEQAKIDTDVKAKEKSTAETTANTAKDLAITAAREGDGRLKNNGTFVVRMGDANDNIDALMAKELGEYWVDNNRIEFDTTSNAEVIDAYNKMIAARDRLKEEGKQDNDVYRELNREIKAMSESMPDLVNAQQHSFELAKEEALLREEQFNKDLGLKQVSSVEAYTAARADLIEKLKEEKDWTEAQAEAYLKASKAYGAYEQATSFFGKDGLSGFDQTASKQTIKEIKEWFANLPEEERTLAMTIDYTTVGNVQEAKKALEEAREKMRIADATKEATDLGADADAFEAYATILQATNKHLKNNKASAYEVAAANVRVNKGLEDLNKTWDDSIKKIRNNTRGTYEYAEGIGEISAALETMFGVKPSINFVETHLNDIERMLNGDKQAFEELQDSMSEDYVKNMLIEPEIVFDGNEDAVLQEADTIKNALQGALDELGDIEVGDNVVLSEKYTKVLQDALDAGQITQKQLEEAFKIKGYDLNFKTKTVPGPTTHYIRTYDLGIFGKQTVEYDEKTEMTVPLLNDADATVNGEGGSGSTVTATRNADGSSLSANITEGNANKKKDQLDDLKNEKDRYHEINEIISDTERNLDKLSKAKDRAFGENKVAAIKDEIKAQKELIKNNKELLKEAKDYLKIDQKELIKNTASNLAIQFDEYGRIANYEALQNSYIKRLKAAAGTERYEDIEKEYEQFKEAAKQYEETLNKVEDQQEKVNDELDRLSELHVEEIETKVEIKVEMADDDKAYIDFLMQKTEDDAFAAAERIGNYGGYAKAALTKINAAQEGIDDTQRKLEAGEITPAQAVELMRQYREELIDGNAELLEIRNNVQDELTGIFEAFHEEIENGIEKLEHYGAVLNGYKNIIDIVGKGMLGLSDETMNTLNKAIVSNANDTIRAIKAQKDANDKTIAEMKQAREEAAKRGDDASVKEWDKQIETAEAKGHELTTNLQDALTSGLEAAATAFGDTVDQIIDGFAKQVSGIYDSIEEMREAWDRSLEVADRYLQTYEQTYELNKLNRNIQKSIDSTDSIQAQKQLRGLQEEMYEMTKDGQQLSKYDLEYLQKKYDLLVAEQAFKDAQNAKSVVRLQRDSEGNYGYVYTADQDAINNAEQAYEDKLYAYQKWSADMDKELTELYISVNEKYVENMAWVKENFTEGTAEYQEHMDRVNREYQEDMAFITGENEKLINRNLAINQQFSAGVAETYKDTFLGQIQPNYNSFAELFAGTTDACEQATIQLNAAVIGLRGTFDEQFRLAGEDFDDFAEKANDKFGEIQQDSSDTADEIEDLADKMEIEMGNAIDAVEDFQIDYSAQMKKVRDQTDNTIKKVEALIEKYNKLIKKNNEANNLKTPTEVKGSNKDNAINQTTNTSTTKKASNTPKTTVSNIAQTSAGIYYQVGKKWYAASDLSLPNQGHTEVGDIATVIKGENGKDNPYQTISLKNASWDATDSSHVDMYDKDGKHQGTAKKLYINENNLANLQKKSIIGYKYYDGFNLYRLDSPWEVADNTGPTKTYWLRQKDLHELLNTVGHTAYSRLYNLKMFDTGGYTGEWGPEGRLAMLHQKEIVLNAHDTENLLTAVSMIREISSQLESNALAMQYIGSLGKVYSAIHTGGDTLQQEVHITAEFPNATDHNEIEEAFKNLTNLASQYANRKS